MPTDGRACLLDTAQDRILNVLVGRAEPLFVLAYNQQSPGLGPARRKQNEELVVGAFIGLAGKGEGVGLAVCLDCNRGRGRSVQRLGVVVDPLRRGRAREHAVPSGAIGRLLHQLAERRPFGRIGGERWNAASGKQKGNKNGSSHDNSIGPRKRAKPRLAAMSDEVIAKKWR